MDLFSQMTQYKNLFRELRNFYELIITVELIKELNLVFPIPCLYTKHGNKLEADNIAFIDVDSAKNNFS